MKRTLIEPDIPKLQNAAIALNIDFRKRKEHILIGNFEELNRYLHGGKNLILFLMKCVLLAHFCLTYFRKQVFLLIFG